MAVPAKVILVQGNSIVIRLYGLQDLLTLTFWNAATASGSLYDQNGVVVPVASNIVLTYQAGSNGNYVGIVTMDYSAPVGTGYTLKLDANQGGQLFHLELIAEVGIRSS